ncbi:MAG: hypothetical protein D6681_17690 [Calditrichaeota bacterium]|nr:MAG: hypothetical protein D6681_17690 [Calditrichota bacterium]
MATHRPLLRQFACVATARKTASLAIRELPTARDGGIIGKRRLATPRGGSRKQKSRFDGIETHFG